MTLTDTLTGAPPDIQDEDLQWIAQFGLRDFRTRKDYQQDRRLAPGEYLVCRIFPREEKVPAVDSYQSDPFRPAKTALSVLWVTPAIKLVFGHGFEYSFVFESGSLPITSITALATGVFGLFINLWTREYFKMYDEMHGKLDSSRSWNFENYVFPNAQLVRKYIIDAAIRGQTRILIDEIRDEIDDQLSEHLELFPLEELQTMYANLKGEHPSEMKRFKWFGTSIFRSVDMETQSKKVENLKANVSNRDDLIANVTMSLEDFETIEVHLTDNGDIVVMHADVSDESFWTTMLPDFMSP